MADVNRLLAVAAHEIRNPLGAINLHTRIISKKLELLDTTDSQTVEEINESVEAIAQTSARLENILNEFLDFSKPIQLDKREYCITSAVEETVKLINPLYEDKNIKLSFNSGLENGLAVGFDRTKLHQVIFNILKNAYEASKENSVVEVLLNNEQKGVSIKISDQGTGIEEQYREKIFEPYFTTKKTGTGLGLAESRKIIEAHNGQLYVEPQAKSGTTFVISLPIN